MKHFLIVFSLLAVCLLGATACHQVEPDFKYSLELTGDVSNVSTAFSGNFAVSVRNDQVDVFSYENAAEMFSIYDPEGAEAKAWLDSYVEKNVVSKLNEATAYDVYVKGYLKEINTGIVFSVDKRFTNKGI